MPTEAPTVRTAGPDGPQDIAEGFGDAQEFFHQPLGGPGEEELRHRHHRRAASGERPPHYEGQEGFEGGGVPYREQAASSHGDEEGTPPAQGWRGAPGGQASSAGGSGGWTGKGWRSASSPSSFARMGFPEDSEHAPGSGWAFDAAGTSDRSSPTAEQQQIALAAAAAATKAACRCFPSGGSGLGSFSTLGLSSASRSLAQEVLDAHRAYLRKQLELLDAVEADMADLPTPRS